MEYINELEKFPVPPYAQKFIKIFREMPKDEFVVSKESYKEDKKELKKYFDEIISHYYRKEHSYPVSDIGPSYRNFTIYLVKIMKRFRQYEQDKVVMNLYADPSPIGCDYITIFANTDVAKDIPESITIEDRIIKIRKVNRRGFVHLRNKVLKILRSLKGLQQYVAEYSLDKFLDSAFLLLVCNETPFQLAGFKLIVNAPSEYLEWDVSGGLISMEKGMGSRLMNATEQIARALHIPNIEISSVNTAIPFYLKMGFSLTKAETENQYMTKTL